MGNLDVIVVFSTSFIQILIVINQYIYVNANIKLTIDL